MWRQDNDDCRRRTRALFTWGPRPNHPQACAPPEPGSWAGGRARASAPGEDRLRLTLRQRTFERLLVRLGSTPYWTRCLSRIVTHAPDDKSASAYSLLEEESPLPPTGAGRLCSCPWGPRQRGSPLQRPKG